MFSFRSHCQCVLIREKVLAPFHPLLSAVVLLVFAVVPFWVLACFNPQWPNLILETLRCRERSTEPERERKRPTATEANNGRDLSLGRASADTSGPRMGIRWLLARPVA
jgi:hypothetical protein